MEERKEEILEYLFRNKDREVFLEEIKKEFNFLDLDNLLKSLVDEGKIKIIDERVILTEEGSIKGEDIKNKHELIEDFLKKIGVPEDYAHEKACEIEHHVKEEKYEEVAPLLSLNIGEVGEIVLIRGGRGLIQRLFDMGLTPGTEVKILRKAPFGPIEISVRGYHLVLGQGIVNRIWVKRKS